MPMTDPLTTTYRLLATTANAQAVGVLTQALDAEERFTRGLAAAALAERRERPAHVELVRRFGRLDDQARAVAVKHAARLSAATAECLASDDPERRRNALEFVRATERYELLPAVLDLLNMPDTDDLPARVFRELVNLLEAHCTPHREPRPASYLRNAAQTRHDVLTHLDRVTSRFNELRRPELIVEAVLILGDADNFAVARVLKQAESECRELAGHLLLTSRHPAILDLLVELLSRSHPSPRVLRAVEHRTDPEFVMRLLTWLPAELTETQRRNFARVSTVAWLRPERLSPDFPPPQLQPALVRFLLAVGIPEDTRLAVQEWIIRHGTPEGRLAAADALPLLETGEMEKIVVCGLESHDESIQAWATGQLRAQGVAEAFSLLVERLDSPLPAVREAARRELAGFNLDRVLQLVDHLDPAACRRTGKLLRKIDSDCGDRLGLELRHPMHARRARAVRAAAALGLEHDVLPELLVLVDDADSVVRRTVGEVLAGLDGTDVAEALKRLLADEDGRVRRATIEALERRRARVAVPSAQGGRP
ncbi:MAG TPA: HEAT repeat domain-containing protein [Planctomycetaceae bacterium]|nr:HEAT repeat domain-containing protein [Planctomycetaceae bacterium]